MREDYSDYVGRIRIDHISGRVTVVIPSIAITEVTNALRKYYLRGLVSEDFIRRSLELLRDSLLDIREITRNLIMKALDFSIKHNVAIYDAVYVVLAMELNTVLYTADEALINALGNAPYIRHVRDYVSST
ncbi:MAG: type II toxin-antitoxin system VapC family toxin [Vulcanisaeta sp.]|uniref:type II toxin-antitoxin system VapC family toxin n=1 Tax=Vulcanisaeta sp. TaxID=2020871 RepID=UPI003D13A4DE